MGGAIVRQVSECFAEALRLHEGPSAPDWVAARRQHAAYVEALEALGLKVLVLPPLKGKADACFVEDRLIVLGRDGFLTRSRVVARSGECESLQRALSSHLSLTEMSEGELDGGDVVRLGQLWLVGLSARTNREGVRALERWGRPRGIDVVALQMETGLHLKCEATPLGPDELLCVEGWPYVDALPRRVRLIEVPREEAYAANALAYGGRAIVAAGYPRARQVVARTGREVISLDVSAFKVADGSLTCLSALYCLD